MRLSTGFSGKPGSSWTREAGVPSGNGLLNVQPGRPRDAQREGIGSGGDETTTWVKGREQFGGTWFVPSYPQVNHPVVQPGVLVDGGAAFLRTSQKRQKVST